MAKYRLLALTNCVQGQDAEFNRWYDQQHTQDVLAVPGMVSAQRFKVSDGFEGQLPWRYLTLYELDTDDPAALVQALGNRMGTAAMPATPALDMEGAAALVLERVGERITAVAKK